MRFGRLSALLVLGVLAVAWFEVEVEIEVAVVVVVGGVARWDSVCMEEVLRRL